MKSISKNAVFVRSQLDLGDFNDDEKNTLPSLTDPSQDEPIEALVARMLRGEIVGRGEPQFDTNGDMPNEEVFARQSLMAKQGFDLADAAGIQKRAEKAIKGLKGKKAIPPAPKEEKTQEAPPGAPTDAKK